MADGQDEAGRIGLAQEGRARPARRRSSDGWRADRAEVMRVQVRAPTSGWTKGRRKLFLEVLAETCNVTRATMAVGLSATGAYALRRRDAAFERLWHQAVDLGRERLEQKLLAHALGTAGDVGDNPAPEELELGGDPGTGGADRGNDAPFDPVLAIKVLALDRGRARAAGGPDRPVKQAELDAALMKRLVQLGERLAAAPDAAERAQADAAALAALLERRTSRRDRARPAAGTDA